MDSITKWLASCPLDEGQTYPPNRIAMSWVVTKEGNIEDVVVFKDFGRPKVMACLAEQIQVKMPQWTPAKVGGESVASIYKFWVSCIMWK